MSPPAGPALPDAVTAPAVKVQDRLDRLLAGEADRWAVVDEDLRRPLELLRAAVVGGGKGLRPAFCFWAYLGAGGKPSDPAVVDAGAALELLHAAALLHDDVIDGSARRRGRPSAHVAFAEEHRRAGWRGDAERFGAGAAILVGDLALVYSGRLLVGAPPEAVAVFDEVRLEVNVGQYLDVLGGAQSAALTPAETIERAERIRRYKTARYTVERPLHLGAALAAPARLPELAGPLSAFGLPLGEAFQLRDDLLGVFGDPERTGKPVGDDLREGKATLLAGLARARATGTAAELWDRRFGAGDLSAAEAADLAGVIEQTGARADVEAAIDGLVAASRHALGSLPLCPTAADALTQLAEFVTSRDR